MQISSNYPHAKSYTVMLKSQSSVKVEKTGLRLKNTGWST